MPMSAIKERPILFSAPMVVAILEGRKTQTRRVTGFSEINETPDEWSLYGLEKDPELIAGADKYGNDKVKKMSGYYALFEHTELGECYRSIRCPYGQPGEHLWVRETWQKFGKEYAYAATDGDVYLETKWRSSIHMPRAISRLTLEITDIRAERLHYITEADAVAEGCESGGDWDSAPTVQYSNLWETINGPGSWEQNPWVWVITFKKI